MKVIIFISLFTGMVMSPQNDFKEKQLKFARVHHAFIENETTMKKELALKHIQLSHLEIYLRVFKQEKELQLWVKNHEEQTFQILKSFSICASSGQAGPKRKSGDMQTPEGFYVIDRFNPLSNFHLSLGIDYPNVSDHILCEKGNLGGDIFIHGNCVTIGCIPITDDKIEELYVYCVEARNNEYPIHVSIYPVKMSSLNLKPLLSQWKNDKDRLNLWGDLKKEYELFEKDNIRRKITVLKTGRYSVILKKH